MFAHELIRQTLLSDLSTPRLQRLHLRVAEAMERIYVNNLAEHSGDLARHYYQGGGDTEKVIEYSVLAAERATAQTAYEDAVEQYERALHVFGRQRPVDELRHCDLLLALGDAYTNIGDPGGAKEVFLRVTEIARKLPAPEQFVGAVLGVHRFWDVGALVNRQLLALMNEGLELLPEEDSALRASLLGSFSRLLEAMSDERHIALSEQAVAMARRVGDAKALYYALRARIHVTARSVAEKVADATELARLEDEYGSPGGVAHGLALLCHAYLVKGDIAEFDAALDMLKKQAEETSHPWTIWHIHIIEATRDLMTGQFEDAERLAIEGAALGQKVNAENAFQHWSAIVSILRWLQGRMSEIEEAYQSATERYEGIPFFHAQIALLQLELGRKEKARAELDRLAEKDFGDLPKDWSTLQTLAHLGEVAAVLRDTRRAALLYDLLNPYADRLVVYGLFSACKGATTHWLGMLAATMKRWDDAVDHFESAIKTNARIEARPFLARSQHEYARMLIERNESGDKEKAKALLTEATATYRELGMPTFLENAEELLAKL
jgi:tetratricopeptide (TPR) repeat protein